MRHHPHIRTEEQMTHQLRRLLGEVARPRLASYLSTYHSADLASAFAHLDPEERTVLWKSMEPEKSARVLSRCSEDMQVAFLNEVDHSLLTQIAGFMEPDDIADFVALAREEQRDEIIKSLSQEAARKVKQLLTYDDDVAGGIMNTEVISFSKETTAGGAINQLRQSPPRQIFYNIYVVDEEGRLLGWCTWQQLLLSDPETRLAELIPASCPSVDCFTPQEQVARLVAKYDIAAIPVVDLDGKLVGTVTNDDVIDVIAEEASEDMMRTAGGSEEELHQPTVVKSFTSRMPWLAITFGSGCIAAFLMRGLERAIPTDMALAVMLYVPLTMSMGGNVGLQTSTATIRRLALGEADVRKLVLDLWRELRLGMVMGGTWGLLIGSLAAFLMPGHANPDLGLVVGASLILAVTVSAVTATTIPVLFQKISIDPAVASSPLITCLNDLCALAIYFTLVNMML